MASGAMPGIWTFVAVELDPATAAAALVEARAIIEGVGGSVVADRRPGVSADVLLSRFALAMDAAQAVLQLRDPVAGPGLVRAGLHTGDPTDDRWSDEVTAAGLASVRDLLTRARPHQVLITATTAALVGPGLPPTAELVAVDGDGVERVPGTARAYELRSVPVAAAGADGLAGPGAPGRPEGDGGHTTSNLGWAHRAAAGPLAGRAPVVAAVSAVWQATLRGERRVAVLTGDAGIGKTAAAAELALRVHADNAVVLYGRWDREQISPYQAFREALGTYADGRPASSLRVELEGHLGSIRRLLPDVAAGLGHTDRGSDGDPDGERAAVYAAVRTWLDRVAADRPVLLVLDDLHWADRSSQRLVDHLCRDVGTAPWTLLMTCRPGFVSAGGDGAAGLLGRDGPAVEGAAVDVVELDGLDPPAICEVVRRALGLRLEPGHEAVAWLATATSGNPLLVQHLLNGVRGSGDAAGELLTARAQLPEPLTDVIRWRLGHLPARTRRVMAEAAVVGTVVDPDLMGEALSQPPVLLRAALDPGAAEQLLRFEADGRRYSFAHEVVRRTLREEVPPERARSIHRRVVAVLEARAQHGVAVPPGALAHHHLSGANAETAMAALTWARSGARAAREATAFDEAVELLVKAVEVHDRFVSPAAGDPGGCELRLELAEAHDLAGQPSARDDRFVEAADLARSAGRADLFCRAALGHGGRLPAAAMPDLIARGLLEEALDRLPAADSGDRALVLGRLAQFRYFDSPVEVRRDLADLAVGMARRVGDPVTLARALVSRGLALEGPDSFGEATVTADEIVGIGETAGDADLVLQGMRLRLTAVLAAGRPQEARQLAVSFARLAERTRHLDHLRLMLMWDIFWAGFEGRYDDVERLAERAADELDRAGHPHAALVPFAYSIVPRWLHGRMELARSVVEFLHAADPETAGWWAQSMWVDLATGNAAQAVSRLGEQDPATVLAGVPRDIMWWPTLLPWAVVASHGQRPWAEALHAVLLPDSGRLMVSGYALFGGAVDHHLGTLALVLGRPDEAVQRLEQALRRHRVLGASGFVGLSIRWLAAALVERGRPGDGSRAAALREELTLLIESFGLDGLRDRDGLPDPSSVSLLGPR